MKIMRSARLASVYLGIWPWSYVGGAMLRGRVLLYWLSARDRQGLHEPACRNLMKSFVAQESYFTVSFPILLEITSPFST